MYVENMKGKYRLRKLVVNCMIILKCVLLTWSADWIMRLTAGMGDLLTS